MFTLLPYLKVIVFPTSWALFYTGTIKLGWWKVGMSVYNVILVLCVFGMITLYLLIFIFNKLKEGCIVWEIYCQGNFATLKIRDNYQWSVTKIRLDMYFDIVYLPKVIYLLEAFQKLLSWKVLLWKRNCWVVVFFFTIF